MELRVQPPLHLTWTHTRTSVPVGGNDWSGQGGRRVNYSLIFKPTRVRKGETSGLVVGVSGVIQKKEVGFYTVHLSQTF